MLKFRNAGYEQIRIDYRIYYKGDGVTSQFIQYIRQNKDLRDELNGEIYRKGQLQAEIEAEKLYAIKCHPEVLHTQEGTKMLSNFVFNVCGCAGDWRMDSFVEESIKAIREKVGNGKVLCALSGGVDSSVAAVLLSKAVGNQLTCVFVDHGLLRKNEGDEVEAVFGPDGDYDLNFIRVNAQDSR